MEANSHGLNAEHASAPYQNRNPRFYASLMYDGSHLEATDGRRSS
jgi:hypothetical protein